MSLKELSSDLISRYGVASSNRDMQRSFLNDAYKYIRPNSNLFDGTGPVVQSQGKQKNVEVYDLTAALAARQFVSKMHSVLTPPYVKWAELTAGFSFESTSDDDDEQKSAGLVKLKEVLQLNTDILFNYIQNSRFELAVNEAYADLIMGTAAIKIEEGSDEQPLLFSSVPLAALALEESPDGTIRTIWMDFKLNSDEIKELWPDAILPDSLVNRKRQSKSKVVTGTIWRPKTKDYYYYVSVGNNIIFDEEFESSPWIAMRWNVLAGETWGRGIAHDVMPTVKSLNKMVELMFRATEISIAPPMLGYSDDVMNISNLVIAPNTIIPISRSSMSQSPLIPLDIKPNVQLGDMSIQQLQNLINKAFLADPIGQMDDPTKTATEIDYRERLLLEEIGPAFGRLQAEFFVPLIERCIFILKKKGFMDPVEINGKEVSVKFSSPLARTQEKNDLQSFGTATQALASLYGELTPLTVDFVKAVNFVADKSGSKRNLFKDNAELAEIEAKIMDKLDQASQPQQGQPDVPQQLPQAASAFQGQDQGGE